MRPAGYPLATERKKMPYILVHIRKITSYILVCTSEITG